MSALVLVLVLALFLALALVLVLMVMLGFTMDSWCGHRCLCVRHFLRVSIQRMQCSG